MKDDLFLKMMNMIETAIKLNDNNRLVALLWHQGETDALLKATFETHYSNLSALVNAVKTTFNCPNLPFIAGDFVEQWKNNHKLISEPVIKAIKAVCNDCANGAFVTTNGLESNAQVLNNEDTTHFSREALYELGIKYFNEFKKVKDN